MAKVKQLKVANFKKQNKRIDLYVGTVDEGPDKGNTVFIIETKRLIDKKTRHIHTSSVSYGLETMTMLKSILDLLYEDPEFNAAINRELGQLEKYGKTEKFKCVTNIIH